MPHDSMRIFSEKVMFLEISTSSDRPVPLRVEEGSPINRMDFGFNPIRKRSIRRRTPDMRAIFQAGMNKNQYTVSIIEQN